MKTAYSYVRLSSKRQRKGTGEQRQLARPSEICKEKGWELSKKTFKDLGISAFTGKNRLKGDLANFIQLAKDGALAPEPVLIIEDFSRFSRQDIDESEPAILNLLRLGVDIHVAFSNKTFTKEATKDLVSRIEILVCLKAAHDFSANLSKRLKSAVKFRKEKINSGEVVKHPNTPRYYTWNKDKKQYEQNEASEVVKVIIKEYLNGSSLYGISNKLNDEKRKTIGYEGTAEWTRMSIKGILANKALYGAFYDNETYFNDPITDKDTFDRIQLLLKQNSGSKGRFGSDYVNMFRGLAQCPYCHGSMSAGVQYFNSKKGNRKATPKKQPYRYFRCSSVSNGKSCKNKHNFNLTDIEAEFFGVFLRQDPTTLFNVNGNKGYEKDMTALQKKLDGVSSKITGYLDMDIQLPELERKLKALKAEKETISKDIQELAMRNTQVAVSQENVLNFKKLYAAVSADELTLDAADKFEKGIATLKEKLKDPSLRNTLRMMLPSFISRIDFDTIRGEWRVYDLTGKHIYTSLIL